MVVGCGGAAKYNAKKKSFAINRGKKYFAQLLAETLGLRGYSQIVVGGFPGTVCSSNVG